MFNVNGLTAKLNALDPASRRLAVIQCRPATDRIRMRRRLGDVGRSQGGVALSAERHLSDRAGRIQSQTGQPGWHPVRPTVSRHFYIKFGRWSIGSSLVEELRLRLLCCLDMNTAHQAPVSPSNSSSPSSKRSPPACRPFSCAAKPLFYPASKLL